MQRRKFILGMGAVAAGGAAALGTGAVDSGTLNNRYVEVEIADSDATAAVAIREGSANGINVDYNQNGRAQVRVLNANSEAELSYDDAFRITNQDLDAAGGTGDVAAWFTLDNAKSDALKQFVYKGDTDNKVNRADDAEPIRVGEEASFGVHVNTMNYAADQTQQYKLVIHLKEITE